MGFLDQLTSHPDWGKLSSEEKGTVVDKLLTKHPDWGNLSPDEQETVHNKAYAKVGIPKAFHYDPAEAERVESGVTKGVQPSMIQPADLLTFGLAGGARTAGKVALEEGTSLLGHEALGAGLKEGLVNVPAGIAVSGASQKVAEPLTSMIPTDTPVGVMARGVAEQVAGMAPFITDSPLSRAPAAAQRGWQRFKGSGAVAEDAFAAQRAQEAENVATKEKLSTASAKERAAQYEAVNQARATTAEQGMQAAGKAGMQAREAVAGTKVEPSAQERLAKVKTEADEHLAKQSQQLSENAAQEVLPQAKQAAIGQAPPATMEQGPERIERKQNFVEDIRGPLKQWRSNWGSQRNALLADHLQEKPQDLTPIHDQSAEQLKWVATGHRRYSPAVASLLDWASEVGIPKVPTDEELLQKAGYAPDDIQALSTPAPIRTQGTRTTPLAPGDEGQSIGQQVLGQLRQDWENQPHEAEKPTVAELLTKQAQANKLAMSSQGADRVGARAVSRSIDDALSGYAPTDELKALNAEYRDHREHFPYAFEDAIEGAQRPVDVAPQIFNQPERALDLAQMGGDDTKSAMRQLYGQWVSESKNDVINPAHAAFLKEIAPNTPYADPKGWVYEKKASDHLSAVVDSSPEVKARWTKLVNDGRRQYINDYAKKVAAFGFKDAPKFGTAGARLITQMRAARTPEAQMKLVEDFYSKLTPEDAASEAATESLGQQMDPSLAAYHARQGAPRTARQAEQNFVPPDPKEAAIKAIQERGYKETSLARSGKRRLPFTIAGGVGGALAFGHPSGWALSMLGFEGGLAAREALVKSFQESLRDPAEARRFYQAITNPGVKHNFEFLANEAAKAGITTAAERAGYSLQIPQQQQQESDNRGESPAIEGLRTARAETLAPTPSATERAKDLDKELAKGKTPDVGKDLDSGRLSMDETNKLLAQASTNDPKAIVQGMPLVDALNAVQIADGNERRMLLPLIEQRMRAELPKIQNKTLQMALTKKFRQLQQQPAEMEG